MLLKANIYKNFKIQHIRCTTSKLFPILLCFQWKRKYCSETSVKEYVKYVMREVFPKKS